jgi:ubiquinone/menaquinone biosynthesis C-methylase UbiE
MEQQEKIKFQDFFTDTRYLSLKNYLYNYLLRKKAIKTELKSKTNGIILEIGSGISPVTTSYSGNAIVYTDISFQAILTLQRTLDKGCFVVADVLYLPFKSNLVSCIVCSEVIEHIEDDKGAIAEIARALEPGGSLIITFPHRCAYFSIDDEFVGHYRRYEMDNMESLLDNAGLTPLFIKKILGPLEKITMIGLFLLLRSFKVRIKGRTNPNKKMQYAFLLLSPLFKWLNILYATIAWVDAHIAPVKCSAVLLIKAVKKDNVPMQKAAHTTGGN